MADTEINLLIFLQSSSQDEIAYLISLMQEKTEYNSFVEVLTNKLTALE